MRKGFLAALLNLVLVRHVIRLFSRSGGQSPERLGAADTGRPRVPLRLRSKAWLQACQRWWHGCSHFWQHVLINLGIGLVIELALIVFHHTELPALKIAEDAAMDFVMRHYNNVSLGAENNAYVLLDIDQQTYEAWGEPFYVPRGKLLDLIEFAATGNPAVIIVDIDLSKADDTESESRLKEYIKNYDTGDHPPLVLMRTLKPTLENTTETRPSTQRSSFLDTNVSGSGNIFWASPHYKRDSDYRVRRWLLSQPTCKENQPEVLVSVELLVKAVLAAADEQGKEAAMLRAGDSLDARAMVAARTRTSLNQCFAPIRFHCDAALPEDITHESTNCAIGHHDISLDPSVLAQRLIYSIPYNVAEGIKRPTVEINHRPAELLKVLSALDITDSKHQPRATSLEGKVVVIGGSYRETRDWYATPLGEMPGALVIVNAIHSLGVNGQLQPPGAWLKLLIVAVLIIVMSLLFAWFNSFTGMVLASLAVILLLVPLSFFLFQSGVWVDFALPLFAVQVHQIASEFEESRAAAKRNKRPGQSGGG